MTFKCFVPKTFTPSAMALIEQCNEILTAYEAAGYDLSLRQLYYQLVSKNLVENTEKSYKRVGGIVSDARLAGLMDWSMIKDRGREVIANPHWTSPAEILESAADSFQMDLWRGQDVYVEVMVEKQALEGVLIPVCSELDVRFTANKGYSSSSTMFEAGLRLSAYGRHKRIVVFYLGDHDPSGIDMTRDVEDRLRMFAPTIDVRDLTVRRLALNMEQIEKLKPPENPAKLTDSRAKSYVEKFGSSSWELDAIEPAMLADLVRKAIEAERDDDLYREVLAEQDRHRQRLQEMSDEFKG